MNSEKAREIYCEISGIFHSIFYKLEDVRVKNKIDEFKHAVTVIVDACSGDNKNNLIRHLKKTNISNINETYNEIYNAFLFVYNKAINGTVVRKILNDNLDDSDF